jgi:hypothetical protein
MNKVMDRVRSSPVLFKLSCSGCPALYWMSGPKFPDLAVLFLLSWLDCKSVCPVLPVLFWHSWSGCPVLAVLLFGCPVLADLYWLSCSTSSVFAFLV